MHIWYKREKIGQFNGIVGGFEGLFIKEKV